MFVRNTMGHLVPWESLTEQERAQWIASSSQRLADARPPACGTKVVQNVGQ